MRTVTLARKPFTGTVSECVAAHDCGGLNIDGCRLSSIGQITFDRHKGKRSRENYRTGTVVGARLVEIGRWPTNVIMSEHVADRKSPHSREHMTRFFKVVSR